MAGLRAFRDMDPEEAATRRESAARTVDDARAGRSRPSGPAVLSATLQPSVAAPRRSEARPDTSERAVRQQAMWNRALRRELTPAEWSQLNPEQQSQVRLNAEVLSAYDTDQVESPTERRNTSALYSQLGLTESAESDLNERLGLAVGAVSRYGDLFSPTGQATTERGSTAPTPSRDDTSRRELVASLQGKLDTYLGTLQESGTDVASQNAAALPSRFNFDSQAARDDYEYSFASMLDPLNLSSMPWATLTQNLTSAGYNPEDFKAYILERIKTLPATAGQSTAAEIQSWFG